MAEKELTPNMEVSCHTITCISCLQMSLQLISDIGVSESTQDSANVSSHTPPEGESACDYKVEV